MIGSEAAGTSRREFLGNTGRAVAVSALAGVAIPAVHAGENNTIQLALVGCGGRGTGAAANALATKSGPIKLVAMADVFEHRLRAATSLKTTGGDSGQRVSRSGGDRLRRLPGRRSPGPAVHRL